MDGLGWEQADVLPSLPDDEPIGPRWEDAHPGEPRPGTEDQLPQIGVTGGSRIVDWLAYYSERAQIALGPFWKPALFGTALLGGIYLYRRMSR